MTEFQTVARAEDIPPGTLGAVEVSGRAIAIANIAGDYFAILDKCTCIAQFTGHVDDQGGDRHVGDFGRLSEGNLADETVSCPAHSTVYHLPTGRPISGPGEISVATFEVRLEQVDLRVAEMSDAERHFWNDEGSTERP